MRLPAYLRLFSLAGVAGVLSSCLVLGPQANTDSGIHKIKHVIVIMQENRTFDSYFGTFAGAMQRQRPPQELGQCAAEPGHSPGRQEARRETGPTPGLCVDRPHLPPAQK